MTSTDLELRLERLKQISNLRDELAERVFNGKHAGALQHHPILFDADLYRNGRDEMHLHFDSIGSYCATYRVNPPTHSEKPVLDRAESDCPAVIGDGELPVFVWIRDLGQRMRPLASVVRLQRLDCCYMSGADALEKGWYAPKKLFLDGKLSTILDGAAIESGQLIDKIVQGGAEIITDLSYKDSDDRRRREDEFMIKAWLVRGVRLELDADAIMIDLAEAKDFTFKLRKVFACPVDPFKSAIEWMKSHSATLSEKPTSS